MTSPGKLRAGEVFTDRGLGERLVLSARSSGQIAEYIKAHGIGTRFGECVKDKMLCMCVAYHLMNADAN